MRGAEIKNGELVRNNFRARIVWGHDEPDTVVDEIEERCQGRTRTMPPAPATRYMLRFEKRWYRIYAAPDLGSYYVKIEGERFGVVIDVASLQAMGRILRPSINERKL